MIPTWTTLMEKFRIHPKAVCRQLIAALDEKTLSPREGREIFDAIKSTGIPIDRVLATLSQGALRKILEEF